MEWCWGWPGPRVLHWLEAGRWIVMVRDNR